MNAKERLAPLGALLDARYFPLLFAAAPQAYTVYKWLSQNDHTTEGWLFAVIGAMGFEMVYIGAIAWAEGKTKSYWFWVTAFAALVFSVLVALRVYLPSEAEWAFLHSGFPLVAFCYTMLMHRANQQAAEAKEIQATNFALLQSELAALSTEISHLKAVPNAPDYSQNFAEVGDNFAKLSTTISHITDTQTLQSLEMERMNSEIIFLKRETEMRKSAKSAADSGEVSFALMPLNQGIGEMENAKVRSEEVRKLRESMGWKEIADRYGVSTRTVQNWARE